VAGVGARFIDALLAADRPVIMEIKARDAHGSDLMRGRSVADLVAEYVAAGAPCLSVVTGRWYGGTVDMLREAARRTDLPILQKDFITRESQLARAAELGASAVLLTAQLLPGSVLPRLVEAALRHGLTPFVEVVSAAEAAAVSAASDCVVAVNNKDIRQRERDAGDLARGLALLPAVWATGTRCPVSASGIDAPGTAARLVQAGFAGLLVSTALLRTADLGGWLADFDRLRQVDGVRR
jgi:indole-3-glycerol phosphate synthase